MTENEAVTLLPSVLTLSHSHSHFTGVECHTWEGRRCQTLRLVNCTNSPRAEPGHTTYQGIKLHTQILRTFACIMKSKEN